MIGKMGKQVKSFQSTPPYGERRQLGQLARATELIMPFSRTLRQRILICLFLHNEFAHLQPLQWLPPGANLTVYACMLGVRVWLSATRKARVYTIKVPSGS